MAQPALNQHVELYTEYCNLVDPEAKLPSPHSPESWQQTSLLSDGSSSEQERVVVHACHDGEGFFWLTGGYYENQSQEMVEPEWELRTAFACSYEWSELFVFWNYGTGFIRKESN